MYDDLPRTPIEILPSGPITARLAAPASKSVTNRLLVHAALADGASTLHGPLVSDDSDAMRGAITGLGARIDDHGENGAERWTIQGTGGRLRSPDRPIDARLSGTTMRFAGAMAVLAPAGAVITGREPLLRRPIGPLADALTALGADVDAPGGLPPFHAGGGGLRGGEVTVQSAQSSQFASAVMMVSPYAAEDVVVHVADPGAASYIELTAAIMRDWGVAIEQISSASWAIPGAQGYAARDVTVEYDASAAAHLLALAAATGGVVTVTNAAAATLQPDAAVPALLERMGASVSRDGDAITVRGPDLLKPLDADLGATPDQVTTLAALAAVADGTSVLRGVAVARGHETDRLAALATEITKLGIAVEELPDGLIIHGGAPLRPARLATYDDHRLAMAFAALGARSPGIVIEQPDCVAKTYPGFWRDLAAAGASVRAAD